MIAIYSPESLVFRASNHNMFATKSQMQWG